MVGGRGKPLIMVHGLGIGGEDFRQLASLLVDDFTCIIPDLPGFGQSSKPDLPYSPPFFAQALGDMVRELGLGPALWLGHSMGGQCVLWLAATQPELARRVAAICPAGGHLRPDPGLRLVSALAAGRDRLRWFHPGMFRPNIAYACGQPLRGPLTPPVEELIELFKTRWSGPELPLLERSFVRSGRGVLANPVWPLLPRIKAPLLLVTGEGDRVTPERHTERLRLYAPAGTQCLRLGGSHMPIILASWELAQALRRFLG